MLSVLRFSLASRSTTLNGRMTQSEKAPVAWVPPAKIPTAVHQADVRRDPRIHLPLQLADPRAIGRPAAWRWLLLLALVTGHALVGIVLAVAIGQRANEREPVRHRASFGNSSQISRPGTLVLIGLYSPRISTGASGFKSHISM